jgi:hypothetical protein
MLPRRASLAFLLTFSFGLVANGEVYQVGPGLLYEELEDVADLLEPGDIVEVQGDATYPSVWFQEHGTESAPIVIRGIRVNGKRPHLSGGNNTVELQGNWYVFEGFEVTGGASRCIYHHAANIVIRDVVVHDCPAHGILGADQDSGSLLLEHCEVYATGNGFSQHQIYMATDEVAHPGSVFRMQHCYIHDGNGGNNVKSRAERNEIYYNWIEGAAVQELELIGPDPGGAPAGWSEGMAREDSDVVGNVLWSKNGTYSIVRVGGDATGQSWGRYRFVNNTIVTASASSSTGVFRLFDGMESIEMHNNVIYLTGSGGPRIVRAVEVDWTAAGEQIAGSNNWIETGSTLVPSQWTGTIVGADPGFVDLTGGDLRPVLGSPLIGVANPAPAGPPGFAFPSPQLPPQWHPPPGVLEPVGSADSRPAHGALDIGAFEYVEDLLFEDGFESGGAGEWSSTSSPP